MGFKDTDGTKSYPQTYLLTVDAPIRLLHGGVGGSIMQDQLGAFKNINLKLGYAYRTDIWDGNIGIGLMANIQNTGYDASKFKPIDDEDPVLSELDGKASDMSVDVALGAFYRVPEQYYIGLSVDNLLETKAKKLSYQLQRTFYLSGGYEWTLPNYPAIELLPSAQFMFDGAVFQFNVGAIAMYNGKFYGGLGYRFQDAVNILAGAMIKGLHIGVSYDLNTSKMIKYSSGGLEVLVGYCFKIDTDKYRRTYRNTRFL
jgi:type IX secretion system PorP/SprF family membrane protein